MRFFKSALKIFAVCVLFAGIMGCSRQSAAPGGGTPAITRLSIGTSNIGGVYYIVGGALANLVNMHVPNAEATAEVTGGSVDNCNLMFAGDMEVCIANTDVLMYAYAGTAPFKTANTNLRHIGKLYPSTMQTVASASSGIRTIPDLKGKRVAVGAPGAGQRIYVDHMLAEYGMTMKDFTVFDLTYNEAVDAMKDNLIDAAFIHSGVPNSTVLDLAMTKDIVLIPLDEDKADHICSLYPFLGKSTIPADMYNTNSAITVGAMNSLACIADLPEDVVYGITKALFENLDYMRNAHEISSVIDPKIAATKEIPMHPGAERYYKEAGILK